MAISSLNAIYVITIEIKQQIITLILLNFFANLRYINDTAIPITIPLIAEILPSLAIRSINSTPASEPTSAPIVPRI